MKGLNKLCLSNVHVLETMNTQTCMHGLFNHGQSVHKLKNLEFQTNGGSLTWYAPTATLLLIPYISQKPMFLPKIVLFFPHCPKFWIFFYSKTPNRLEFEKKVPNDTLYCHWKTPYFLPCMHVFEAWGEINVAPSNTVRSWKILYSWNRIVQFGEYSLGANLIKVMKTKFQFYRLKRPNCALWMNFIGGQGWYACHHPLVKHPLYDSAHQGLVRGLAL